MGTTTFSGPIVSDAGITTSGTVVATADNVTSLRVKGLQHSSEGSSQVQSYSGIFNNAAYDTKGTLKTRVIHGANIEMDLEIQSPHAILITAVDDTQADGKILSASKTDFQIHTRADAEVLSPKRLIVDRITTGSTGAANTSDVTVETNDGKLYLQNGHVGGGVVFPSYTTAERDALSAVAGEVVFNTSLSKLQVYDGTTWASLH